MKICIDLRFKKNAEGKLILQARWQPVQFSGTYAIQLAGEPTDWKDVDLAHDVLPADLEEVGSTTEKVFEDPLEEVKKETSSKEEKEAKAKVLERKSN